jgi:hypothetical protein
VVGAMGAPTDGIGGACGGACGRAPVEHPATTMAPAIVNASAVVPQARILAKLRDPVCAVRKA